MQFRVKIDKPSLPTNDNVFTFLKIDKMTHRKLSQGSHENLKRLLTKFSRTYQTNQFQLLNLNRQIFHI